MAQFVSNLIEPRNGKLSPILFMSILIITELLEFLMALIFIEVIELKFCELNTNIKENIMDRAIEDMTCGADDQEPSFYYINDNYKIEFQKTFEKIEET